jgi:hypothetical protein
LDQTVLPGLWSLAPIPALIGVVVLVYWLIVSGRLIPRSSHERELAAAEKRNTDAVKRGDEWKATALELEKVNSEIRKQNGQLIQANQVVEAFLNASRPGDTQPSGGA